MFAKCKLVDSQFARKGDHLYGMLYCKHGQRFVMLKTETVHGNIPFWVRSPF